MLTQENMKQPQVAFYFMSGAMYTQTINVWVGCTDTPIQYPTPLFNNRLFLTIPEQKFCTITQTQVLWNILFELLLAAPSPVSFSHGG
jgi:hypothetical protein